MTNSQGPENESEPRVRRRSPRRRWRRIGLGLGAVALVGGAVGARWAWVFIDERLAPLVAESLSETLGRPVKVGDVERVTLGSIRLGPSELPPTETDLDRATVDAIDVRFNLLEILLSRRLGLDVTLVSPEAFVDQTKDGKWLNLPPQRERDEPFLKIELSDLQIQDGTAVVAPYPRVDPESEAAEEIPERDTRGDEILESGSAPAESQVPAEAPVSDEAAPRVTVNDINGDVALREDSTRISFDVTGRPAKGGDFQLQGEAVTDPQRVKLLIRGQEIPAEDLNDLVKLPLLFKAGKLWSNVEVEFANTELIGVNGTARFQDAIATIQGVPSQFNEANGRLRFREKLVIVDDARLLYGKIPARVKGTLHLERGYNLAALVPAAKVTDLLETFDLKLPIQATGTLEAALKLTGPLAEPRIDGEALNTSPIQVDRVTLAQVFTNFTLTTSGLTFNTIQAVPTDGGRVLGKGTLTFGGGEAGETGELLFGFLGQDLPGDALARRYGLNNPNVRVGRVGATVRVSGTVDNFQTAIRWQAPGATYPAQGDILIAGDVIQVPNARLQVGSGTVTVQGQSVRGQWQAIANASGVPLREFSPTLSGTLNGAVRLGGSLSNLSPAGIVAQGQATINDLAGGTVNATLEAARGQWQALVQGADIRLRQFSPDLRGLFAGNLRLSGSLTNFSPGAIRAEGNVSLSEGIAVVNRPTTAAIRWTGDRLLIDQATAPGFSARGYVAANLEGTPSISNFALDVLLQDYDITDLSLPVPAQFQLAGLADFNGQVTGTPAAPNVAGNLGLTGLRVNELAFEPMAGPFRYGANQGLAMDLEGDRDRLAVQLNAQNRPLAFFIRQGDAVAEGRGDGTRLVARIENFPLEALNLAPAAEQGLGEVAGRLTGNFDVNLADLSNPIVVGEVAIAQPAIGYINGDSFVGRIRYGDGVATLSDGELLIGAGSYQINGSFTQGAAPEFRGQVVIDQGRVEDILTTLQFFDIQDFQRGLQPPAYASAATVQPLAVDVLGRSVQYQLQRYSEIVTLLNQQRLEREEETFLPALTDLQGVFSGTIDVANTPATGFVVDFNLSGQDWTWGDEYRVAQVTAIGSFSEGVVSLLPLSFQTDDSFATFSGQLGGAQQSGQLRAQNVPIEALRDLFELPLDITGDLNGTATLAGSVQNPQVQGELYLIDGTLNDSTLAEARGVFGYTDARLNFNGRLVVSEPEPLLVSGSIPAPLPFMDINPQSEGIDLLPEINLTDDITLDVDVKNEGIALLNVLTRNQLTWQGGQGEVNLEVRGTFLQPQAVGFAQFREASFVAQALPEPLTNVTGRIDFNNNLIQVPGLTGQFSSGQIAVAGILPIFDPDDFPQDVEQEPDPDELILPLTVNLSDVALEYNFGPTEDPLYDGQVNGQIVLTGAALAPRIGGQVTLSDGQVFLATNTQPVTSSPPVGEDAQTSSPLLPPRLNDLQVILGENLLVTRPGLLNFVVNGSMTVSGTFDSLRPKGTINLLSGQVNLYTTQFNLDRRYTNQVVFPGNTGLNPFLDLQLLTSVPEVTRNPFETPTGAFPSSEIADRPVTDFGALQTVRIQAKVQGPADELFDNLELTSSPRRSQNEIIALLGGGFVDTLGRGDATLAIANLAGSALLTGIQNFISNALGLSDFRLFPTSISAEDDRTSSFGIAAELGFDITDDLSVSAIQILTDDAVPPQFNLRYRLNNEFTLRGSTNLSGDSGIVLEFESRF